jgi:hypothetical protein
MSPSEYQDLVAFLVKKLDGVETRFVEMEARLSTRLTRIAVGLEDLRGDVRAVAELATANAAAIDENRRLMERNGRRIEENGVRIEANGNRIERLERHWGIPST